MSSSLASIHLSIRRNPRLSLISGAGFVASIGYLDPGNFAANIYAGSLSGYRLLWVLILANCIALLMQGLACRLGAYTGKSLAQNCRDIFPPLIWVPLCLIAEIMMIATDVAEVVGGSIGLHLLFGIPIPASSVIGGSLSFIPIILSAGKLNSIAAFMKAAVLLVGLSFLYELLMIKPNWNSVMSSCLAPSIKGNELFVAVSMIGATVMPHVLFLHSGLIATYSDPDQDARARLESFRKAVAEAAFALSLALLVNCSMLIAFANQRLNGNVIETLADAHSSLTLVLGTTASTIFAIALVMSGLSSTSVGILAGQNLMTGFLRANISPAIRRSVAVVPSIFISCCAIEPTKVLLYSQALLSFALPFTVIPLVWLNSSRHILNDRALSGPVKLLAIIATVILVGFNAVLINQLLLDQGRL